MKLALVLVILVAVIGFHEVSAGFGCPGDQYQCDSHCKSNHCNGGFCDAAKLWLTCVCSGCPHGKRFMIP